jgi:hypothetical protein
MPVFITNVRSFQPVLGLNRSFRRMMMVISAVSMTLLWMSTASASCGNYLYRNGRPVVNHDMHVETAAANEDAAGPIQRRSHELPVRKCSGPNCSRSSLPLAPVPAAPSNLIRGFDPAAILETLLHVDQTRGAMHVPQSERGARYEPSSIFRPPAA